MSPEQCAAEISDWAAELVDAIDRDDTEHAGISIDSIRELCEKLEVWLA